jgi:hypothetical protein
MNKKSRKYTLALLDAIDNGFVEPDEALQACLKFMSDADIGEMIEANDFLPEGYWDKEE